jgi:TonB family protein
VFVGGGADAFGGDGLAAPLRCLREARQRLVAVGVPAVPAPLADLASLTGGRACAATELPRPRTLAALAAPAPATLAATAATAELGGVESWEPLETVTGEVAWIGRIAGALPPADRVGADDLEALWARARIGRGDADDGAGGERIVTPLTSLLVLENDGDYPRWGLPVPRAPRTWWRTARTVASAAAALPAAEAIPEWMKKKGQDDGPGRAGVGRRDRGREPLARAQAAEVGEPARDEARTAGALGVMRPSGTASIFGRDSAIGRDADSALGSLIGNQIGEAYGVGGFGLVGRQGGGSTSEGTVGLGNLGTIGVAPGHRWYAGARQRGSQQPDVVGGQVKTTGGLDRDVIGRTIRSHLKEVKFCYEQELMRRPSLHGRVTVKFAISPTGSVSSSAVDASTVNDARVERCIAQAVQRWEFPKPAGGGVVIVSYPFVLAAGSPVTRPTPARPARPPETEWQVALRILADGAVPLMTRVARIATLLRAKDTSRPEVLGWWLATAHLRAGAPDAEVFLLVSRLLDAAKQARDAVRVLAEGAVRHPDAIARELRRRGRAADAERVQALAARGPR